MADRAQRTRYTLQQKQQFLGWFNSQDPVPSQKDACEWFKAKFGTEINKSLVSKWKNNKTLPQQPSGEHKAISRSRYPVLEQILKRWHVNQQRMGEKVTRPALREQAKRIWREIPEARDYEPLGVREEPEFGNTWVRLFQKRFVDTPQVRPVVPQAAQPEVNAQAQTANANMGGGQPTPRRRGRPLGASAPGATADLENSGRQVNLNAQELGVLGPLFGNQLSNWSVEGVVLTNKLDGSRILVKTQTLETVSVDFHTPGLDPLLMG